MKMLLKIKFNFKFVLFLILISISILFSIKHTLVASSHFILGNIAVRESFLYENNINYKGTHEPGRRFMNLISENILTIKNLNFLEMKESFKKIKNIDVNKTEYYLEYALINKLIELSDLPVSEKKISAIYIPKNISTYWNISCDRLMAPFIVPAITNIIMLGGLPIDNIESCYGHRREYGYARYREYNKSSSVNHLNPQILCKMAKKEGLKKIIELIQVEKKYFDTIIHNC